MILTETGNQCDDARIAVVCEGSVKESKAVLCVQNEHAKTTVHCLQGTFD